jgi:N-methylhydantoinase A/oxoprolinase/acetone carboxylase beta subunit
LEIGVDVGGTFTDVVAVDSVDEVYFTTKVPTRAGRPADGILFATLEVLRLAGASTEAVSRFVHGTTIGTNAVLERSAPPVAILATEGFEDVLEIGRLRRSRLYDMNMDAETPVFLSPRRYRRGIRERVDARGDVIHELDEEHAEAVVRALIDSYRVESFAVCFLHSYKNPDNELAMRKVIHRIDPDLSVSLSSEVDPMFREYERTVVTAFDAYLRPSIKSYLEDLVAMLREAGISAPIHVMRSNGGVASAQLVARRPVSVLLSGPAAGTLGGSFAAREAGIPDAITIDIGGTSADVALIEHGRPLTASEGSIGTYPLRVPMIDITTIGAGGGSIAVAGGSGRATVGPESAGADPGPACYGRGGRLPTVTDASVVLGYLNPNYVGGGRIKLDVDAAHAAVATFADALGFEIPEAADGIHRIVNSSMAEAIRMVSIKRGHDPRKFALVVLGGGGAVHGGRLAAELDIRKMIVPPSPGVLSAQGLLLASVIHGANQSLITRAEAADPHELEMVYGKLERDVSAMMESDGAPLDEVQVLRTVDVRYVGQSYTLEVAIGRPCDRATINACVDDFHAKHRDVYGHDQAGVQVELVNFKVVQTWDFPERRTARAYGADGGTSARPASRSAFFSELGGFVDTPILGRNDLAAGDSVEGPAIIEQADTTLVVYPGHRAAADDAGNLVVSIRSAPPRAEGQAAQPARHDAHLTKPGRGLM